MNLFITKYALTQGIVEAELVSSGHGFVVVKWKGGWNGTNMFSGKGVNWHETREGAVRAAYAMRNKKVLSLHKQVERLSRLEF